MDFEREKTALVSCPSCGAVCDDVNGPTHPYLAATRGCWAAFGAVQADEMARFGYPAIRGLVVDAYMASHGGDGSDRRDRQSVCIHLMALCAILERGESLAGRIALLQRLTARKLDWPAADRPDGVPALATPTPRDQPTLTSTPTARANGPVPSGRSGSPRTLASGTCWTRGNPPGASTDGPCLS